MAFDPSTAKLLTAYAGADTATSDAMDATDKAGGTVDVQVGKDGKVIDNSIAKGQFNPKTAKLFNPDTAKVVSTDKSKSSARQQLDEIQPPVSPEASKPETIGDKFKGANETLTSLLTGLPAHLAGSIAGLFHGLTSGQYGTEQGVEDAAKVAADTRAKLASPVTTESGKANLAAIGSAMDATKIAGINPTTAIPAILPGAGTFAKNAITDSAKGIVQKAKSLLPTAEEIPGIGAAEVAAATLRRERAADLPIPINLTKGQAERTFEQQKFERETAKLGIGAPIRERYAEQNSSILQNFDSWIDQTGAEAPTLRATGSVVNDALVAKSKLAKNRIQQAYTAADKAGEMAAPVSTDSLVSFLEENRPAAINAPVLTTAEQKLLQLGGATKGPNGELVPGTLSIGDMEELRKLVGNVSGSTPTNIHFGMGTKSVIDAATEGAGGDLYRAARRLRSNYANEFENKGVVDKLLRNKPGTTDRAVALEDVFAHSILSGSLDDVRTMRKTLQTAGAQGEQAWKELQGQTVSYLKEQATKNVARDIQGNPIVSASGLDKAIKGLDKDGKLDFVFGRKGAQQLRDINDLAKDVYTAPPGSVNTSNTSSALMEALGKFMVGRVPTAAAKVIGVAKDAIETRKIRQQIGGALNQPMTETELARKQLGY